MATLPTADSQNEDPEKMIGSQGNRQSPDLSNNSSSSVELPQGDQKIIIKATDKDCQGKLATDLSRTIAKGRPSSRILPTRAVCSLADPPKGT